MPFLLLLNTEHNVTILITIFWIEISNYSHLNIFFSKYWYIWADWGTSTLDMV